MHSMNVSKTKEDMIISSFHYGKKTVLLRRDKLLVFSSPIPGMKKEKRNQREKIDYNYSIYNLNTVVCKKSDSKLNSHKKNFQ